MVCKASILDQLGGPYIEIYIKYNSMQGLYA